MLFLIGEALETHFGPFRLFTSHLFLIVSGTAASFLLTFLAIPRSLTSLPSDRGRSFAVQGHVAELKRGIALREAGAKSSAAS